MKRRDFLKLSSAATMAYSINGIPIHAYGQENEFAKKTRNTNGKKLVLIRLNGGNDGLNMVIPLDKYAELTTARANLLIPTSSVLPLTSNPTTGLHPAMTEIQNLHNAGKVNIVQGVSYPDPSYSHFRATDIYSSASDSSLYVNSGWIGRFLDSQFPGSPQAFPNSTFTHPLSIEIGSMASSVLIGSQGLNGFTISNIDYFYNIVNGTVNPAPNTRGGNELTYVRFIAQQTQSYTSVIQNSATLGSNSVSYPSNNELADQLKIVAKLISGGLETPVYIVTLSGFDNHSFQVESSNHTTGTHANLLGKLSSAIGAFQQDLENQNLANDVVGLTFSEFGRRIIGNASQGSDHGVAAPMIVFGTQVNPTMVGTSPLIPTNATVDDSVPMQNDFRQVYSTVLTDWFGLSTSTVNTVMNGNNYSWLPIFSLSTALAIRLIKFYAVEKNCEANLLWETEMEENFSHFEIMYSENGLDYFSIANIPAKGSNSQYLFTHTTPSTKVRVNYKLKMVDLDGKVTYSQVAFLNILCNISMMNVYPNPADTFLNIDVKGQNSFVTISIINAEGQIIHTAINYNGLTTINTQNFLNGFYTVVITNLDKQKEIYNIVIKH